VKLAISKAPHRLLLARYRTLSSKTWRQKSVRHCEKSGNSLQSVWKAVLERSQEMATCKASPPDSTGGPEKGDALREWLVLKEAVHDVTRRKMLCMLRDAGWAHGERVTGVRVFWLQELAGAEDPIAAVALVPVGPRSVRILRAAVAPQHRSYGIESKLVADLADVLRAEGIRRLIAAAHAGELGSDVLSTLGFTQTRPTEDGAAMVLDL
jgi:ribosomal protein S18 acetylase RimI-like enzyme